MTVQNTVVRMVKRWAVPSLTSVNSRHSHVCTECRVVAVLMTAFVQLFFEIRPIHRLAARAMPSLLESPEPVSNGSYLPHATMRHARSPTSTE